MNNDNPITIKGKPINPFIGKVFKVVTFIGNTNQKESEEIVKIESQFELKTILEDIKQYNDDNLISLEEGYAMVKKLITE